MVFLQIAVVLLREKGARPSLKRQAENVQRAGGIGMIVVSKEDVLGAYTNETELATVMVASADGMRLNAADDVIVRSSTPVWSTPLAGGRTAETVVAEGGAESGSRAAAAATATPAAPSAAAAATAAAGTAVSAAAAQVPSAKVDGLLGGSVQTSFKSEPMPPRRSVPSPGMYTSIDTKTCP